MNSKRVFYILIGICILLGLGAVGVLLAGNNLLKKEASELVQLKLEDRLLDEQQTALIQANKDIEEYEELEQIAKTVVPQDKDQARAVREIIALAKEAGVPIGTISFPASNLGAKAVQTKPTEESETKTAAPISVPVSQAKPVEGVPGVYALEMTIMQNTEQRATYYELLTFLEKLENNRRTAQVTSVKISPDTSTSNNPYITFSLTINIFVKP